MDDDFYKNAGKWASRNGIDELQNACLELSGAIPNGEIACISHALGELLEQGKTSKKIVDAFSAASLANGRFSTSLMLLKENSVSKPSAIAEMAIDEIEVFLDIFSKLPLTQREEICNEYEDCIPTIQDALKRLPRIQEKLEILEKPKMSICLN